MRPISVEDYEELKKLQQAKRAAQERYLALATKVAESCNIPKPVLNAYVAADVAGKMKGHASASMRVVELLQVQQPDMFQEVKDELLAEEQDQQDGPPGNVSSLPLGGGDERQQATG